MLRERSIDRSVDRPGADRTVGKQPAGRGRKQDTLRFGLSAGQG